MTHRTISECSYHGAISRSFYQREINVLFNSSHFIYGYMASDIWLRTILIVRKETCCHHIGYYYQLTARVLLYAPSHSLCYTSRGALAGTRNSSMGPPHEGSIRSHRTMSERSTSELRPAPIYLSMIQSICKLCAHTPTQFLWFEN